MLHLGSHSMRLPVSSFSQHDKPITRERNVIHFGGYFIYGGHGSPINVRHQACKSESVRT